MDNNFPSTRDSTGKSLQLVDSLNADSQAFLSWRCWFLFTSFSVRIRSSARIRNTLLPPRGDAILLCSTKNNRGVQVWDYGNTTTAYRVSNA